MANLNLNRNKGSAMSEYSQEQYEQLPEFMQNDLVKDGDVYKHSQVVHLKKSLNEVDNKYKTQLSEVNNRLTEFEASKQQEIEAARAQALEEARTKGDVEAIEQRYQEQMADLESRTKEATRKEVEQEFNYKNAQERANTELEKIIQQMKPVDDDAADLLRAALQGRQKVTEDGKIIYTNADGSASTLTATQFAQEQRESAKFKRLVTAEIATKGGLGLKGSGSGSAATGEDTRAKLKARLKSHGI